MSSELLGHLGYGLIGVSYLVKEILYLRLLSIAASLSIIAFSMTTADGLSGVTLGWNLAFMTINGAHCVLLIRERLRTQLTAEEEALHRALFPALDAVALKRLLHHARWVDQPAGTPLAEAGRPMESLTLIVHGAAEVRARDKAVAKLVSGQFVGEMSFLGGRPASADVVLTGQSRCVVWPKESLYRMLEKDSSLRAALHAVLGTDMAGKLAERNAQSGAA